MTQVILLDNEAVRALADPAHPKHRRAVGYAQLANQRKARAVDISIAVPSAVRVEAGWNHTRLRTGRSSTGSGSPTSRSTRATPTSAAAVRTRTGVSVADAHLGAAVRGAAQVTVLTSDPGDMRLVAEGKPVGVVAL